MKLVRYGDRGNEKPGVLNTDGEICDLADEIDDIAGDILSGRRLDALRALDLRALPVVDADTRLGPCVGNIGKIICVGRNYAEHAAESGKEVLDEPIIFSKATSSINGPFDSVMLPRNGKKTDWEVELGVVIGERASYVSEAAALSHVAGYCIVNDVSERDFQLERHGQWVKGKSCDTFAPIGPWLVTADEVPDPQKLDVQLSVNGKIFQNANTDKMVYKVKFLISYISQFMTLEPGDVIATGTPSGVGLGQKPPVYLKPGDVMELNITGLGAQRQEVIAFDENCYRDR